MKNVLKEMWNDPLRILLYLGYLTGFLIALAGVLLIFSAAFMPGSEQESLDRLGQAGIGGDMILLGIAYAFLFWFIFEHVRPWVYQLIFEKLGPWLSRILRLT